MDVTFTLAPTSPPKVQHLSFVWAKPLTGSMKTAAESLAALIGAPSAEGLDNLAAASLERAALLGQIEALRLSYGACCLADAISGDGSTDVRVRLDCERGSLTARLRADSQGKLLEASFAKPAGERCVP